MVVRLPVCRLSVAMWLLSTYIIFMMKLPCAAGQKVAACWPGSYYNASYCYPCPTGEFNDKQYHYDATCHVCTVPKHGEVDQSRCNATRDAVFQCAAGLVRGVDGMCVEVRTIATTTVSTTKEMSKPTTPEAPVRTIATTTVSTTKEMSKPTTPEAPGRSCITQESDCGTQNITIMVLVVVLVVAHVVVLVIVMKRTGWGGESGTLLDCESSRGSCFTRCRECCQLKPSSEVGRPDESKSRSTAAADMTETPSPTDASDSEPRQPLLPKGVQEKDAGPIFGGEQVVSSETQSAFVPAVPGAPTSTAPSAATSRGLPNQGTKGDEGLHDRPGLLGRDGDKGMDDLPGLSGRDGPKDLEEVKGLRGSTGDKGSHDEPGFSSPKGSRRSDRLPGGPGRPDSTGEKGRDGAAVLPGLEGSSGDKGDRGDPGLGLQGPRSEKGRSDE